MDDDDNLDQFLTPTEEAYADFYTAWDYPNGVLSENKLPDCLITMQRSRRSRGFFASEQFGHREREGEIALNPATFRGRAQSHHRLYPVRQAELHHNGMTHRDAP